MKECIRDEGSDVYEETNYLFEVRSVNGLKGQVYYNVDADGNSRAHPPNIRKVGSLAES